jgi:ParB family transcriptional regulator, chromosome partitioning protein
MSQAFELVPIERVVESPLNPRKHYNQRRLADMADSIRQSGIISPLIVRERDGKYEIAAGHRRRRAAIIAGLAEVPVIIRPMDDATFLEILNIENLQREDIHPLEEADGFARLLDLPSYSVAVLAERMGKSESYVVKRLALRSLIPMARELFIEERINISHAILLARLQAADQERLCAIDEKRTWDSGGLWDPDRSTNGEPLVPVPAGELARTIEAEVYLNLKGTPWNKADAELVPTAGACINCGKRTGANLALFDDVQKDRCLDRACYDGKRDAHLVQIQARLAERGTELPRIALGRSDEEVHKGVRQVNTYEVKDKRDKDDDRPTEKALVVAGPRRGEVVDVYVRANAIKEDPAAKREREAEEATRKLEAKAAWEGRKLAWKYALEACPAKLDSSLTALLITLVLNHAKPELAKTYGLEVPKTTNQFDVIEAWAFEPKRNQAELTEMLLGIIISPLLSEWINDEGSRYGDILNHLGVDLKDCQQQARQQLAQKAGFKGEPAKAVKTKGKK